MNGGGEGRSKLRLTLWTTLFVLIGAITLCQVFEWLGFPEQSQVREVRQLAGWNWKFAALVAWILVATPIIEESLFRGLLFRLPSRLLSGPAPCESARDATGGNSDRGTPVAIAFAVFSSAAFAFAHYIDFASLLAGRGFALLPFSNAGFALFCVGLSWCWLYRRTGSLWCSMLSHSLFNAVNLVLALCLAD